jgi:CHAT domain-containing protein
MTCEEAARDELVERYAAGDLDKTQAEAFEEHFFDCPRCLDRVRAVQARRGPFPLAAIAAMVTLLLASATAFAQSDDELRKMINDGKYREAEPVVRKALADREAKFGPESEETASALDLLMEVLQYAGKSLDADGRGISTRAIALEEKLHGPTSRQMADTLIDSSNLYTQGREPVKGRELAERAVAIYESLGGTDYQFQLDMGAAVEALGFAQRDADDPAAARVSFEKALKIYDKAGAGETRRMGLCLNNLATIYSRLGRYEDARDAYTKALAIYEKTLGPEHPFVVTGLNNLGGLLMRMGKAPEAIDILERSEKLQEKNFGPDNYRVAAALSNWGKALSNSGRYAEAQPVLERALDSYIRAFGPDNKSAAGVWNSVSYNLAFSGKTSAAIDAGVRTEAMIRSYDESAIRGLPEREALLHATARATSNAANGLNLLLSFAVLHADAKPGFDQLIRSRAGVFDEMAARHRAADRAQDPEVEALADALAKARQALSELVVRGPEANKAAEYATKLKRARDEKEQAERRLAVKSERFRNELAGSHAGLSTVSAALPRGSVLISYARYIHSEFLINAPLTYPLPKPVVSYMAFVLHAGDAEPVAVRLGTSAEIDELIKDVREKISQEAMDPGRAPQRSEQLYRTASARLRQKIWDPIATLVGASERVFIVPDGDLSLVNFAALPTGATAYLIEHGPLIDYLSTERDVLAAPPAGKSQGLLALGNPAFDRSPTARIATLRDGPRDCSAFEHMRFDRLPDSAREVQAVAALWKQSNAGEALALTGEAATKEAFHRQAAGKLVIHLATHGFFLGSGCKPDGAAAANPLLLSGLVLAGANQSRGAGILTAEEIAGMNLEGVDWAVLSGCDTALGEYMAGEGVFGLRRAFQLAGARTVIMSVWPVEDRVTRLWMEALYRSRIADHKDAAQSVKQASLSLLRARRMAGESTHPLYWGGFFAAGRWN